MAHTFIKLETKCTNVFYIVTKNSDGNYYVVTSSEFSFDIRIIIIHRKFFPIGCNRIDHQVNLVKEYLLIAKLKHMNYMELIYSYRAAHTSDATQFSVEILALYAINSWFFVQACNSYSYLLQNQASVHSNKP